MPGALVNEHGFYIGFDDKSVIPLPPETWPPYIPVWVESKWAIIEDHRGEKVYKKVDGSEVTIDDIEPIPNEYTTIVPELYSAWDEATGAWIWDRDRWLNEAIRPERDARINAVMWRYERWDREERMGLKHHDDIKALDEYVQELCDLPEKVGEKGEVEWPKVPEEIA